MIRTVASTATAATTANRFTTEPLPVHTVGLGGLEPPTSSLSAKRSNHLSYRPVHCFTADRRDYRNGAALPNRVSIPVGERHFDAADDVGAEVVDERPAGGHRRQQHDVDQPDEQRATEDRAAGHQLAAAAACAGPEVG